MPFGSGVCADRQATDSPISPAEGSRASEVGEAHMSAAAQQPLVTPQIRRVRRDSMGGKGSGVLSCRKLPGAFLPQVKLE